MNRGMQACGGIESVRYKGRFLKQENKNPISWFSVVEN